MSLKPDGQPSALFFIPTLAAGGAERVCVQYVNDLETFQTILMLQFRRGELLEELHEATPILSINAYTGFGERERTLRRRLHREIRRRRRRLQVRMRYLRRSVRAHIEENYGVRVIRYIWEAERAANFVGRRLRAIGVPFVFLFMVLANLIRGLLRLVAAPVRLALGLPVFADRQASWGIPIGAPAATLGLAFIAPVGFLSDWSFLVRQARLLSKAADARKCDIIVSFLPFTNAIAVLSKVLFDRDRKVVINVHSVKTDILGDASVYDQRMLRFLVQKIYNRADRIIAVSVGIKQDLVANFGIPEDKIQVVHNPIDVTRINRLARQAAGHPWIDQKRKRLVVAVGRLVTVKGFDLLIRAFAELPPQVDACLMIIGDGPERATLQNLAEQLGVEQRVAFVGFQQNPWKFMKQADCLALSSRTEGLPMVIGEALALELPIVAADCSHGVREFLGDSQYGMIVAPNDAGALSEGIREMLENEALRLRFAQRARDRVRLFDRARIVDIFESSLHEVIES